MAIGNPKKGSGKVRRETEKKRLTPEQRAQRDWIKRNPVGFEVR